MKIRKLKRKFRLPIQQFSYDLAKGIERLKNKAPNGIKVVYKDNRIIQIHPT